MCNIDSQQQWETQSRLLLAAADIFSKMLAVDRSADVLGAATSAYQQGKITKAQFMAVIDALDEATYQNGAYHPYRAWLDAKKLNKAN